MTTLRRASNMLNALRRYHFSSARNHKATKYANNFSNCWRNNELEKIITKKKSNKNEQDWIN